MTQIKQNNTFKRVFERLSTFIFGAIFGVSMASVVAYAVSEPPPLSGPPAPMEDVVEEPEEDKIACGNLLRELEEFRELHEENGVAIGDFLTDLKDQMNDWVVVFNPLAGKTVQFKAQYFQPVAETRDLTDEISDMVYDNTGQLDLMIEKIYESLEVCL